MDVRALVLVALVACAAPSAHVPITAPALTLSGTDGQPHVLRADIAQAPATVFVFFDPHCPCMTAHEARLRELHEAFAPRGVRWFMVDSEVGASLERAVAFSTEKTFGFPTLVDDHAVLARTVGAQFATFSVVVDREGVVRYAGGVDDDRSHLRDDATPYLRDALTDVLAGTPVRRPEGKALGCALQLW